MDRYIGLDIHAQTTTLAVMVDAGQRSHLALLTLARKIAETVLHIWKHEEVYDPTKHKVQAAA